MPWLVRLLPRFARSAYSRRGPFLDVPDSKGGRLWCRERRFLWEMLNPNGDASVLATRAAITASGRRSPPFDSLRSYRATAAKRGLLWPGCAIISLTRSALHR